MSSRAGHTTATAAEKLAQKASRVAEAAAAMRDFVNAEAGHEGAEVPHSRDCKRVHLDPEAFGRVLGAGLQQGADPEDLLGQEDDASTSSGGSEGEEGEEGAEERLSSLMAAMDAELGQKAEGRAAPDQDASKAVQLDANLVANLLEACGESPGGLTGPASSLLASMGVRL